MLAATLQTSEVVNPILAGAVGLVVGYLVGRGRTKSRGTHFTFLRFDSRESGDDTDETHEPPAPGEGETGGP